MPASIVKALRCIHSGASIRGPLALLFEVRGRNPWGQNPGPTFSSFGGLYTPPTKTRFKLTRPITIQNMRFENCGTIPLMQMVIS